MLRFVPVKSSQLTFVPSCSHPGFGSGPSKCSVLLSFLVTLTTSLKKTHKNTTRKPVKNMVRNFQIP